MSDRPSHQAFHSASEHPPLQSVQGSAFFRAWVVFVLRFRWLLLAATLALTGYLGVRAVQDLGADTSDEHFLAQEAEATVVLRAMREQFGNDVLFQVLVGGDVFSTAYLERLKALHEDMKAIDFELEQPEHASEVGPQQADAHTGEFAGFGDGDAWGGEEGGSIVDEVVSLINVRRTYAQDDALRVEGLLDTWPTEQQLPELKAGVLASRTLVGQVVDSKGEHSVLALRTRPLGEVDQTALHRRLLALKDKHHRSDFRVMIAGAPAVSATLRELMLSDTRSSMALSSLVMLFVTFLFFRHPVGIFGPPLVVWQAEVWTLGTMAITDTPLTMVTTILPAFIGCVGLGDTVHVLSVYRNARADGYDNEAAIVHAVATTGLPVFLTTFTTAVGLMSFRLASLSAIQEMGTFGSLGVFGALLNSIVFLPILLTFNKKSLLGLSPEGRGQMTIDRLLLWFDRLSAPRRRLGKHMHRGRNRVLLASAIIAAISVAGLLTLRVYHDGLAWFPEDNPTRLAIEKLEDTVGGTSNLAIMFDARPGRSLKDRETLLAIQKLERHVQAYDDGNGVGDAVRNTTSLLDPIRESWRAMHGNDEKYYGIPDTERGVQDMFMLFENAGPDQLTRMATVDMERALMTVRVKWRDAMAYRPLVNHLNEGIEHHLSGLVTAQTTGSVFVAVSIVTALLEDLLKSFGTALAVITVLMVFVLRDPKVGLLAMLPNLLPISVVMGYMGYRSIPLDTATLMLGSVAIGIVVDDTIHFLHQFKVYFDEYGDVDAAVRHAFMHTGRAMFVTSLILVIGFCCLMASELLSSRLFGYLVSLTVIAAVVFDFTFLPALLRVVYRRKQVAGDLAP